MGGRPSKITPEGNFVGEGITDVSKIVFVAELKVLDMSNNTIVDISRLSLPQGLQELEAQCVFVLRVLGPVAGSRHRTSIKYAHAAITQPETNFDS